MRSYRRCINAFYVDVVTVAPYVKNVMATRPVIERLGGITAVANGLDHRNPSTVQGWWDREVIPSRKQRSVLALATRKGVIVRADELMPVDRARS